MTGTARRLPAVDAPVTPAAGRRWLENMAPGELHLYWHDFPEAPYLLRLGSAFHLVVVPAPIGLAALSNLGASPFRTGAVAVAERTRNLGFLIYPSGCQHFETMLKLADAPETLRYRYSGSRAWFLVPGPHPQPGRAAGVHWLRPPRFPDDFTVTAELAKALAAAASPGMDHTSEPGSP